MIDFAGEQQLALLGLLAVGDIDGHAADTRDLVDGILACRGRAEAPPHASVGTANAEFDLIATGIMPGLPERPAQTFPIVGMNQLPNACWRYLEGPRLDSEDLLLPLVPGTIAMDEVPIPRSHLA